MESEKGWSIPLERVKDGRRVYYRYAYSDFSIKKQAINESETNQLRETLSILNRFKGMPQFEWMEKLLVRIHSAFQLESKRDRAIIGFEQNPYLKGLEFITVLFNTIQYKRSLDVVYKDLDRKCLKSYAFIPISSNSITTDGSCSRIMNSRTRYPTSRSIGFSRSRITIFPTSKTTLSISKSISMMWLGSL